jgi:SET domain-containing protein
MMMRLLFLFQAATPVAAALLPSLGRVEPLRMLFDALYALQLNLLDQQECMVGVDVEIREAGGQKGLGVFALRALETGELVGRYSAPVLSMNDAIRATEAGTTSDNYSFSLDGADWVLDAEDATRSNWLRYLNHSRRRDNVIPGPANIMGFNYAAVFQVSRPIQPGEELLFDYGAGYWDRLYPNRLDPRRVAIDYL